MPQARKLGFNEQRELGRLPSVIESLESEERELNARIAGPDFYKEAADEIRAALARVDELQSKISAAYTRWDELDQRASGRPAEAPDTERVGD